MVLGSQVAGAGAHRGPRSGSTSCVLGTRLDFTCAFHYLL